MNPPSAMLNMNLCLVAFFFSSPTFTTGAAAPASLVFSPFCSLPDSSVFTPSFSSFGSEEKESTHHPSSYEYTCSLMLTLCVYTEYIRLHSGFTFHVETFNYLSLQSDIISIHSVCNECMFMCFMYAPFFSSVGELMSIFSSLLSSAETRDTQVEPQ